MATGKTSTPTLRIEPALKEELRAAAECEHRSIATMVEVLIRDWCSWNDISIPEQNAPAATSKSAAARPTRKR